MTPHWRRRPRKHLSHTSLWQSHRIPPLNEEPEKVIEEEMDDEARTREMDDDDDVVLGTMEETGDCGRGGVAMESDCVGLP